jgi:YqjK-like protein
MKDLAARREALVAQAAVQRTLAADATAGIRHGLISVERGVGVLRYLARKPLVLGLGVVAIALLIAKPRQTVTWLGYAVTAYTMFRRARRALSSQGPN